MDKRLRILLAAFLAFYGISAVLADQHSGMAASGRKEEYFLILVARIYCGKDLVFKFPAEYGKIAIFYFSDHVYDFNRRPGFYFVQ